MELVGWCGKEHANPLRGSPHQQILLKKFLAVPHNRLGSWSQVTWLCVGTPIGSFGRFLAGLSLMSALIEFVPIVRLASSRAGSYL